MEAHKITTNRTIERFRKLGDPYLQKIKRWIKALENHFSQIPEVRVLIGSQTTFGAHGVDGIKWDFVMCMISFKIVNRVNEIPRSAETFPQVISLKTLPLQFNNIIQLKDLESALGHVDGFENPKFQLEQYNTSAHLASRMLFTADTVYDDIEGKSVADFGTGSGMLAIAAQILGSSYTVGFDLDDDALDLASRNAEDFEVDIDFVHCNLQEMPTNDRYPLFDTVIMNPPFGTRTKGIDVIFLQRTLQMCTGAVYSLHKTSTRNFLMKKAKEWGVQFEVVAVMKFDLPKMYKFHKKKSVDVEVDMLRFSKI